MATLGTMVERIRSELHQGPATAGTAWGNEVRLQIRDAIRRLQGEHFYWSEGSFTLETVAAQEAYALNAAGASLDTKLPADLQAVEDSLFLREDQDADDSFQLQRLTRQAYLATKESYDDNSGTPLYWTFFEHQLFLWPVPDAAHDVVGRYHRNFENFSATWNGTAWTIASDATTSAWFTIDEAEHAVRTLAERQLCLKYLNDPKRAAAFKLEHDLALQQLRHETAKQTGTGFIQPWMGGMPA